MPMPSMTDLQTMYGAWNPQAYLQGQQNAGLEQQFQQETNNQAQLKTQADALANDYTAKANPLRIQGLGLDNSNKDLTNEGKIYENKNKAIEARRNAANEFDNLQEDAQKHLLAGSENDYKIFDAKAEQMSRSLDPDVAAQGTKMLALTQHARDLKQKQEDTIATESYKLSKETLMNREKMDSAERIATIQANGRLAVKNAGVKGPGTIEELIRSGKVNFEKAATMYSGAAATEEDPDKKALYEAMATKYEQANLNQKNAQSGGKPDVASLGVPATAPPATVLGTPPTQAPPAIKTVADLQKMYPGVPPDKLKQAYKKKFGVDIQ